MKTTTLASRVSITLRDGVDRPARSIATADNVHVDIEGPSAYGDTDITFDNLRGSTVTVTLSRAETFSLIEALGGIAPEVAR